MNSNVYIYPTLLLTITISNWMGSSLHAKW